MSKEKVFIQIDDNVIELKGVELKTFLEDKEIQEQQRQFIEAERIRKIEAKEKAIEKLKNLGLTDEEIAAII